VLDHGQVVENGRPAELIAADGLFARLYRQQIEYGPRTSPSPLAVAPDA
jgi:ABC-type transport system involved in cytochrome bd biosynthesis fused ATPase/permease subunit